MIISNRIVESKCGKNQQLGNLGDKYTEVCSYILTTFLYMWNYFKMKCYPTIASSSKPMRKFWTHCNLRWCLQRSLEVSRDFPVAQTVKTLSAMQKAGVWSLGWKDPLEKGTATHSSIVVWWIPYTEEPDGLQSTGLQRVRHDWAIFITT